MNSAIETHRINENLFVAVARTDEQFQQLFQTTVKAEGSEQRFARANPDIARNGLPRGAMGVFIVGKNGVAFDSDDVDYDDRRGHLKLISQRVPDVSLTMSALALVPYRADGIKVQHSEVSAPDPMMILFHQLKSPTTDASPGLAGMLIESLINPALTNSAMKNTKGKPTPEQAILEQFLQGAMEVLAHPAENPWTDDVARSLVRLSKGLLKSRPETSFWSVGNSPSYVVYGIDQVAQKEGRAVTVGYIPFSGRYLDAAAGNPYEQGVYELNPFQKEYRGAQINKNKYRGLLEDMGFSPQKIVDQYGSTGRKTAIIDNMQTGTSFATFVHFVHSWAADARLEKPFGAALECIGLTDKPRNNYISVSATDTKVKVSIVPIDYDLRLALNGNMSMNTDRFVPEYPPQAWGKPPVAVTKQNEGNVRDVKNLIQAAILEPYPARPDPANRALSLLRSMLSRKK